MNEGKCPVERMYVEKIVAQVGVRINLKKNMASALG